MSFSVHPLSGFSPLPSPSPQSPTRFIIGRLLHPRLRNWPSFSVASISTVLHRKLIVATSPALNLAVLLRCLLCCRRSTNPVLRSPLPSPPSPPSDCTGPPFAVAPLGCSPQSPFSANCFSVAYVLADQGRRFKEFTQSFLQVQLSGSDFGGTRT